MSSKRWPKRKLNKTDGEYILWHVLESLMHSDVYWHEDYYLGIERAMDTCRALLKEFTKCEVK